ncbi:hypothetical protein [Flavobacterium sp. 28A]
MKCATNHKWCVLMS